MFWLLEHPWELDFKIIGIRYHRLDAALCLFVQCTDIVIHHIFNIEMDVLTGFARPSRATKSALTAGSFNVQYLGLVLIIDIKLDITILIRLFDGPNLFILAIFNKVNLHLGSAEATACALAGCYAAQKWLGVPG